METKEKKQVVSAISKATNILVTVGVDPSVDELTALLGLTLLLNKLDKHATAVFSGKIPPAISFLEPDKTFEDTVDGLRDFIIALNKDKADHLRYKLDGDMVKIFITPYKNTIIRDTDLEFSQGDFNVELILALGVENKADLDTAVASHGRILHDATTISFSAGDTKSELGEIDWHAASASSLCEMLFSLARDLGDNLLDEQVATALMTGIVSRTERFSNSLTTSDVMKTAASLMAAGANQQLIAARLEEAGPQREEPVDAPVSGEEPEGDAIVGADGSMQINHQRDQEPIEEAPTLPDGPTLVDIERNKDRILQEELDHLIPPKQVDLSDLDQPAEEAPAATIIPESRPFVAKSSAYDDMSEPSIGGTLNATTEQAEEDNRAAVEDDRNRVILSHNAPPAQLPENLQPAPPVVEPDQPEEEPAPEPTPAPAPSSAPQPSIEEALASLGYPAGSQPTLADLDQRTGHVQAAVEVDDARAAVANALDTVFAPENNPAASVGSQPLGPELHEPAVAPLAVPVFEPAPAAPVVGPAPAPVSGQPTPTAIDLPPLPPLPPLPGQPGGLPPLPPLPDLSELDAHQEEAPQPSAQTPSPTDNDWQAHTVEPPTNDPGQFHIPGQK